MKIAKEYKKGIFCIEGEWETDLRNKKSIKSTLAYLEDCLAIKNIYRNCSVKEQFVSYLNQTHYKKYDYFSLLYIASHGETNKVIIGKNPIELDEIAEICKDKFQNKIIHFGCCSTLNLDKRVLKSFVRKTNALCISGYKLDIDFNKSTVLDILYFEKWKYCKDVRKVEREMKKEYKQLIDNLGFRMVYN